MFQKPKAAKRLFFDVIPKAVDEYLAFLAKYPREEPKAKLDNPVWHIHAGNAAAGRAADQLRAAAEPGVGLERRGQGDAVGLHPQVRAPMRRPRRIPLLDQLVGYALAYYHDFVKPAKTYRLPTRARSARRWRRWPRSSAKAAPGASGEELQNIVYEVGKAHGFEPLRAWFAALYEVLLGPDPRPALRRLHRALRRGEHAGR